MKKNILLFFLCCSFFYSLAQTINPSEATEQCPHPDYLNATIADVSTIRFEIDFISINASDYTIITDVNNTSKPIACKVISNIQPISSGSKKGQCYIAFQDQRGSTPKFTVKRISTGALKDFKFPLIRSLKDLSITTPVTLPVWDFPLCTTGNVPYTTTVFKYKRTDNQQDFGFAIPNWEYLVPQGWTVSGQTSDGVTPILAGINATITYDQIHSGNNEIKIRGSQAFYLCDNLSGIKPVPGKWLSIPFTRPIIKLTSGGSSYVSVQCGYPATKTFVLENANLASCITHYVWNLGSNDNGWLYGGAAAPATIPINGAANNSITLTSICNKVPSNISVTAYAGTQALGTYPINVTFNQTLPIITITGGTGSPNLCISDPPVTYTLSSVPCNATVSWTVSPSGVVNWTSTGNNVTITPVNTGNIQLIATVIACGQTVNSGVALSIGQTAPVQSLTIDGVDPATATLCRYTESMLMAYPGIIAQNVWYEWYLPGGWATVENGTPTATTQDYILPVYPGGDGTVSVRRLNECGYSDFYSVFVTFDPWCGNYYTISPNPATDNITVDGQKQKKNIKEVQILDKTGQVRRMVKFGNNLQRVNLNISGLTPDVYYIKIFDGKEWRGKPIRVQ